ncbi:MAG: carboxylate-amine ligase [Gemmatimonadetes bacterium]|nr:carboxylate-amine ligase [Gemmatimonadota bacterium]
MKAPSLTLGIEEEYQVVHPETGKLTSFITEILDEKEKGETEILPELHQACVEVASRVCETVQDARAEVIRMRRLVRDRVGQSGLRIAASGTHPFSTWSEQKITPLDRYVGLREDLQEVADRNLIFGMHVHVGIEDREFLIDAMNVSRYFLPHVLALSASSPFWEGRSTGLHSYRTIIWANFPRTGIPMSFGSAGEYDHFVETMVRSRTVEDSSKIWWDLRPSNRFPTLEFRVCDMCTRVDEVVCIAAIFQAIVAKLWKLRQDNLTFRLYPEALMAENKWRAARYGIQGKLIDFGKQSEHPAKALIAEMVEWFLDDIVDDLGTRAEVEYALRILKEGTSADRQMAVYQERGDMAEVVRHLTRETTEGL